MKSKHIKLLIVLFLLVLIIISPLGLDKVRGMDEVSAINLSTIKFWFAFFAILPGIAIGVLYLSDLVDSKHEDFS